ncbi:hypothetical protein [Edaphobacter bradus]|uniref:hypothetical protein n=1 Tax=Edaphobacter bradus TaxID=2259016 RepID=UPI0021E0F584|nr:hypothetical protein [Edaphobacter bradus]
MTISSPDACRGEHRGIRAVNQVFQVFDKRLDIFDARPDPQVTSFDPAEHAVSSSRQFDTHLYST